MEKSNGWECAGHTLADGGNVFDQLLELVWGLLLVGVFLEKIDALYAVSGGQGKASGESVRARAVECREAAAA